MTDVVARTSLGEYVGTAENGLSRFRGIPYAAPPTGVLRFAPPQAETERFGRREAREHGPIAPQNPSRLSAAMGAFVRSQDEDCLTLSVWAPEDARDLPVLVWVHGGAWISGAGSLDWYDGGRLAREGGIVVVGVNHRLGALGYLDHPGISPGNLGTLDVAAALGFVAREIAAFGGDPDAVTVGGQSAGASTIGRLIAGSPARAHFHRAILQSGAFGRVPLTAAGAAERARVFAGHLGIDLAQPNASARMRAVPVKDLLAAQGETARGLARFADTEPPFPPTLSDGATELADGIAERADGLDLLLGTTGDEAHAFFALDPALDAPDRERLATRAQALTGRADALAVYAERRPGGTPRDLIADMTSDGVFRTPTLRLAEAVARRGGRAFAYQFDWAPPGSRFKACHCIELPFVFGNLDSFAEAPMLAGGDAGRMAALSETIRRDWASFVRIGAPRPAGAPPWTPYDAATRATMVYGERVGLVGDPAGLGIAAF